MIDFACPHCAKRFRVPPDLAGRTARCKSCGNMLTVPAPAAAAPAPYPQSLDQVVQAPAAAARIPLRTRRLIADAQHVEEAFGHSEMIQVRPMEGSPPEVYHVSYRIHGLGPTADPEAPEPRDEHLVEIRLTGEYPRVSPACRMLTPVFHPNIDPSHICVGDHWAAGERLVDLIVRIGEMLAFQAYNIRSPLDAHAAMWADLNADKLPTDGRTVRPAEA